MSTECSMIRCPPKRGNSTGGRDGTLWYYRALVTALRAVAVTPLIEELERTVREVEQLAAVTPEAD